MCLLCVLNETFVVYFEKLGVYFSLLVVHVELFAVCAYMVLKVQSTVGPMFKASCCLDARHIENISYLYN